MRGNSFAWKLVDGLNPYQKVRMKEIPLTRGLVAQVDDRDYALLMRLAPWHAHKGQRTFYAVHSYYEGGGRCGRVVRKLLMHHVIMGRKYGGRDVDHADGNGLNNQRANLRWSTRAQNGANRRKPRNGRTSEFKGVSFNKRLNKFCAYIGSKPKKHLGVFVSEEDAARAYDRAAREHFGAFAKCNFA